jgi:dihydroorotase
LIFYQVVPYKHDVATLIKFNSPTIAFLALLSRHLFNEYTRYLTDRTTSEEIQKAYASGVIFAAKYYPAGATTNSDLGVTDITKVYPALHTMAELGMVLCIHSEVTDSHVDIFDRESNFIETIMKPLVHDVPKLKIVMEHISTKDAVDYILQAPDNVKATITCHHLLYNRNGM